jgi:hypothetical protein
MIKKLNDEKRENLYESLCLHFNCKLKHFLSNLKLFILYLLLLIKYINHIFNKLSIFKLI